MKLATKMRQLTESVNLEKKERDDKQYERLLREIEISAKDNNYYIYTDEIYSNNVERLEMEGFKVTQLYLGEYKSRISWRKKYN